MAEETTKQKGSSLGGWFMSLGMMGIALGVGFGVKNSHDQGKELDALTGKISPSVQNIVASMDSVLGAERLKNGNSVDYKKVGAEQRVLFAEQAKKLSQQYPGVRLQGTFCGDLEGEMINDITKQHVDLKSVSVVEAFTTQGNKEITLLTAANGADKKDLKTIGVIQTLK